jgi:hypothetical protein
MIPESRLLDKQGRPRVDFCNRKSGLLCEYKFSPVNYLDQVKMGFTVMENRAALVLFDPADQWTALTALAGSMPRKKRRMPRTLPTIVHEDQALTIPQWCLFNGFSERHGARILAGKDRPKTIQFSDGRIGITIRDNRIWQESRKR